MADIDFTDVIKRVQDGDESAFTELYNLTCSRVSSRAKACVKNNNAHDAEELVYTVYTEAYRNIHKLTTPEATMSWLYEITYRQGCKMYSKERQMREDALSEENQFLLENLESDYVDSSPELSLEQKETAKIVREIIEELPEAQKMAILMFYFDEMKIEQIADMMDCSTNTVKSRLNYARKYIRDQVEKKEKEGGYRLHVFSLPILWLALKMFTEESSLPMESAGAIYVRVCETVGIAGAAGTAASAVGASTTATASTTAASVAGTKAVAAAAGAKAMGAKASVGMAGKLLSAKALIIAGAVVVAGAGAGIGVKAYIDNSSASYEEDSERNWKDEEGITKDGFEYSAVGDTVTIIKYVGEETDVVIPKKIAGRKKIIIGENAFENTNITSIEIGDSVVEIKTGSLGSPFHNCDCLTRVIISGKLKVIPKLCFWECTSLVEVELGEGIEEIGDSAFFYCVKLETVEIPESVRVLGKGVFASTNVSSITVSEECQVDPVNYTGFPGQKELIVNRK